MLEIRLHNLGEPQIFNGASYETFHIAFRGLLSARAATSLTGHTNCGGGIALVRIGGLLVRANKHSSFKLGFSTLEGFMEILVPRRLFPFSLIVISMLATGCGDDGRLPTAPVSGKILFEGKPLQSAEIWLVPSSEEVKNAAITIRPYARTKDDGTFIMTSYLVDDGAPLGNYAVMVLPALPMAGTEEELATDTPAEGNPQAKLSTPFPRKYADPTTSGLTFTVKEGPNELNLELKSR